jgi:hypothetical protein
VILIRRFQLTPHTFKLNLACRVRVKTWLRWVSPDPGEIFILCGLVCGMSASCLEIEIFLSQMGVVETLLMLEIFAHWDWQKSNFLFQNLAQCVFFCLLAAVKGYLKRSEQQISIKILHVVYFSEEKLAKCSFLTIQRTNEWACCKVRGIQPLKMMITIWNSPKKRPQKFCTLKGKRSGWKLRASVLSSFVIKDVKFMSLLSSCI